jgi:hypothetical protein
MSEQDSRTSKEKVAVLRTHADICKGAVEVRIERQALKDHAAIFDGAADEIERLQRERDDLYRANVDLATRLAPEPCTECARLAKEITRITRGDVSNIITTLGDALTYIGQLERARASQRRS